MSLDNTLAEETAPLNFGRHSGLHSSACLSTCCLSKQAWDRHPSQASKCPVTGERLPGTLHEIRLGGVRSSKPRLVREKKGPILGALAEHSTWRNFLLLRRNVKWSDTIKLTILYFDFVCGLFIIINLLGRSGGEECPKDNSWPYHPCAFSGLRKQGLTTLIGRDGALGSYFLL